MCCRARGLWLQPNPTPAPNSKPQILNPYVAGLEDYGYSQVERDVIFHLMDEESTGKISYPYFFRSAWLLSEHVSGLADLLRDAYHTSFSEDGLRRIISFMEPRVRILQRIWRAYKLKAGVSGGGDASEEAESPAPKRRSPEARGAPETAAGDITARGQQMLQFVGAMTEQQEQRKAKSHALGLARLMVINLRADKQRRRVKAVKAAASRWAAVAAEAWPASLRQVRDAVPVKDARQLVRRCHDDPDGSVDPVFANKKIWVCESCCRKYNSQVRVPTRPDIAT